MGIARSARVRVFAIALLAGLLALLPGTVAGASTGKAELRADLNGAPLQLSKVGNYYCHDFAAPVIHCFTDSKTLETSVAAISATSSVSYVVIFDFTSYAGGYMYLSQDYSILGLIGWNDRISSFIVVNGQSGVFWTDWLYSGVRYAFCCGQSVPYLAGYDNTFSSVFRG
jgi:hypothetical protein